MKGWIPLPRWKRWLNFILHRLPFRRCMVCDRLFYNPMWWHWTNFRWADYEYCSKECADDDWNQDWSCGCGEFVDGEEYVHCPRCGGEPPWGCGGCAYCDALDEEYDSEFDDWG